MQLDPRPLPVKPEPGISAVNFDSRADHLSCMLSFFSREEYYMGFFGGQTQGEHGDVFALDSVCGGAELLPFRDIS